MLSSRACVVLALALASIVACDKKQDAKPVETKPVAPTPPEPKRVDLGSGSAEVKPTEDKPTEAKPPADPFADWSERKGDGFSVLAPQDPKVQTKDTNATGKSLPTTMYTHYVPDGPGAIQVMYTQLDKDSKLDAATMFGAMKDSMVKQFAGKVTKHQDIKIGTAKGQEYWLDGEHPRMGKLSVHVKFLLHERRLYLVQALYSASSPEFAAIGDKFLGSFKLL